MRTPILGAAIEVRRSPGVNPLVICLEEVGLSDPDGLEEKAQERWPKPAKRQSRRGCLTLDAVAATTLGMNGCADHPYVRKDSLIWVGLEARVPGWYVVERIQDLTALRAEGGAHVFLIEKPFHQATATASTPALQVSQGFAMQTMAKRQSEEAAVIQENADLGSLEDLL